ncbi:MULTISPECIES: hypothetical protein [Flavobacterium]|jgi:hypothetical protein|uniref:Uncharacterized protein n=1 Tax=Flavobacterium cupriresistens TaxID=2893885 RepID=A0ABU4RCV9_9FLAO|nr:MULTISPECIES: hypothetical protein [unclassified Flavobacterium]KLT70547.1 hypothetical protein AB674_05285 [Flavobacterium sp. ABG]MDX6190417.1 hypothetical protein [Flavobacterium sp. Fl-318]UFH43481.1 hypothetical protein LNP23_04500 [Flavobacterium sp. F-323]
MAPTIKKYFTCIIFLALPMTLSLYAQSTIEEPTFSVLNKCKKTASTLDQNKDIAEQRISQLDTDSNQFIEGLSIPKDSLATTGECNLITFKCEENSSIAATYSVLAKDIIENYRYDFSESFINILFFEDIDLARTRTI